MTEVGWLHRCQCVDSWGWHNIATTGAWKVSWTFSAKDLYESLWTLWTSHRGRCWKWMEMGQFLSEIQAEALNLQPVCFAVNIPTGAQGCLRLYVACFALECQAPKRRLLRLLFIPLPLCLPFWCATMDPTFAAYELHVSIISLTHSWSWPNKINKKKTSTSRVFMQNTWQIQNAIWAQFACKHTSTLHNSFKTQEHRIVS